MNKNWDNLTDEQRKQITMDDVIAAGKSFFVDSKEFEKDARTYLNHTPNGKKHWQNSSNFFDAIKPYVDDENMDSPFIFDLRRQQYETVIAYVNSGANDFNSTQVLKDKNQTYVPSAMVAAHFNNLMQSKSAFEKQFPGIDIGYQKADKSTIRGEYKITINDINNLLYIYRQLRDNPKGLNWAELENQKELIARWGIKDIKSVFAQMDKMLEANQQSRFDSTKETTESTKQNLLQKLFTKKQGR